MRKALNVEEAMAFFDMIGRRIRKTKNYNDLEALINTVQLPDLPEPPKVLNAEEVFLEEDELAGLLMPPDVPSGLVPLEIWPDGNCLFSVCSLFAFATQTRHMEMRVRIIVEIVSHIHDYLDATWMLRGHNNDPVYMEKISMYTEDGNSVEDRVKKHVFNARYDGQYASIFHIAAAAVVLGRPLYSIYPVYGGHTVRGDINRIFLPRENSSREPGYLLWSSTSGVNEEPKTWKPNHFVILLPQQKRTSRYGIRLCLVMSNKRIVRLIFKPIALNFG